MSISCNVSGAWKTVAAPFVNVSGTWKAATVYANVSGTWKMVGSSKLPAPTISKVYYSNTGDRFKLTNIVSGATPKLEVYINTSLATAPIVISRVSTYTGYMYASTAWLNWAYPLEDSYAYSNGACIGSSFVISLRGSVSKTGYVTSDYATITAQGVATCCCG